MRPAREAAAAKKAPGTEITGETTARGVGSIGRHHAGGSRRSHLSGAMGSTRLIHRQLHLIVSSQGLANIDFGKYQVGPRPHPSTTANDLEWFFACVSDPRAPRRSILSRASGQYTRLNLRRQILAYSGRKLKTFFEMRAPPIIINGEKSTEYIGE